MSEVANPHDRFFREVMSQQDIAAELVQLYMPAEVVALLGTEDVEVAPDTFVDEKLHAHLSDLVLRVWLRDGIQAYIYILLEHKSTPDKWVIFQIVRYLMQMWERVLTGELESLPVIFPVVFYHGKARWAVADNFSALFNLEGAMEVFRPYLPEFRFHLCDLSRYRDEDLVGRPHLRAVLTLLKHIFDQDVQPQMNPVFRLLLDSGLPATRIMDLLKVTTAYLHHARRIADQELEQAVTKAVQQGGPKNMETFIERWINQGLQQGLQQGRQEGLQQGRQEEAAKILLTMARCQFPALTPEMVAHISALSVPDAEALATKLLNFQTLNQLRAWLKKHPVREWQN